MYLPTVSFSTLTATSYDHIGLLDFKFLHDEGRFEQSYCRTTSTIGPCEPIVCEGRGFNEDWKPRGESLYPRGAARSAAEHLKERASGFVSTISSSSSLVAQCSSGFPTPKIAMIFLPENPVPLAYGRFQPLDESWTGQRKSEHRHCEASAAHACHGNQSVVDFHRLLEHPLHGPGECYRRECGDTLVGTAK